MKLQCKLSIFQQRQYYNRLWTLLILAPEKAASFPSPHFSYLLSFSFSLSLALSLSSSIYFSMFPSLTVSFSTIFLLVNFNFVTFRYYWIVLLWIIIAFRDNNQNNLLIEFGFRYFIPIFSHILTSIFVHDFNYQYGWLVWRTWHQNNESEYDINDSLRFERNILTLW